MDDGNFFIFWNKTVIILPSLWCHLWESLLNTSRFFNLFLLCHWRWEMYWNEMKWCNMGLLIWETAVWNIREGLEDENELSSGWSRSDEEKASITEIWCVCMENHGLHKLVLPLFKAISHIAKSNPIIIKLETISPKSYSPANSCLCSQLRVLHCISKSLRWNQLFWVLSSCGTFPTPLSSSCLYEGGLQILQRSLGKWSQLQMFLFSKSIAIFLSIARLL